MDESDNYSTPSILMQHIDSSKVIKCDYLSGKKIYAKEYVEAVTSQEDNIVNAPYSKLSSGYHLNQSSTNVIAFSDQEDVDLRPSMFIMQRKIRVKNSTSLSLTKKGHSSKQIEELAECNSVEKSHRSYNKLLNYNKDRMNQNNKIQLNNYQSGVKRQKKKSIVEKDIGGNIKSIRVKKNHRSLIKKAVNHFNKKETSENSCCIKDSVSLKNDLNVNNQISQVKNTKKYFEFLPPEIFGGENRIVSKFNYGDDETLQKHPKNLLDYSGLTNTSKEGKIYKILNQKSINDLSDHNCEAFSIKVKQSQRNLVKLKINKNEWSSSDVKKRYNNPIDQDYYSTGEIVRFQKAVSLEKKLQRSYVKESSSVYFSLVDPDQKSAHILSGKKKKISRSITKIQKQKKTLHNLTTYKRAISLEKFSNQIIDDVKSPQKNLKPFHNLCPLSSLKVDENCLSYLNDYIMYDEKYFEKYQNKLEEFREIYKSVESDKPAIINQLIIAEKFLKAGKNFLDNFEQQQQQQESHSSPQQRKISSAQKFTRSFSDNKPNYDWHQNRKSDRKMESQMDYNETIQNKKFNYMKPGIVADANKNSINQIEQINYNNELKSASQKLNALKCDQDSGLIKLFKQQNDKPEKIKSDHQYQDRDKNKQHIVKRKKSPNIDPNAHLNKVYSQKVDVNNDKITNHLHISQQQQKSRNTNGTQDIIISLPRPIVKANFVSPKIMKSNRPLEYGEIKERILQKQETFSFQNTKTPVIDLKQHYKQNFETTNNNSIFERSRLINAAKSRLERLAEYATNNL